MSFNLLKHSLFSKRISNLLIISRLNISTDLKSRIGLEIHARINSNAKIFSNAKCFNLNESDINSCVSYFDAALPGTMPTINRRGVEAGILTGLALNCEIKSFSSFERKHYFYADLPSGYQITQQENPIAVSGSLGYPIYDLKTNKVSYKKCRIRRVQLEHDSAKSLQTENLSIKLSENEILPQSSLLIDLNRAGMGLMEIVTEPDFETAIECHAFSRELAVLLRSIGTCDAVMEEGGFRVDVNVSVHKVDPNTGKLLPGVRVEIKNINTLSGILKASEYEIKRQTKLIETGGTVVMETRNFDNLTGKTISLRTKEDQYDYRFMPEPNLLPLIVYSARNSIQNVPNFKPDSLDFFVDYDKVKDEFDKLTLPQARRDYLINNLGFTKEKAFSFVANDLDTLLLEILKNNEDLNDSAQLLSRILFIEYLGEVKINEKLLSTDPKEVCRLIAEYCRIIKQKIIGKKVYNKLFGLLFQNTGKSPIQIIEENNLFIINDSLRLNQEIDECLLENNKQINQYKNNPKKREKIIENICNKVNLKLDNLADTEILEKLVIDKLNKS